jgi:hypothetical protein
MTISATTQGLRMGVATSSSRPTVPFDGQVISETDTDSLQVYKGTQWAPVSGLQYITGASFSAVATVSMASGVFTSAYKTYMVIFQLTSGADGQITVRVNNAGTPRTAASYYGGSNRVGSNNTNTMTASSAATALNVAARVSGEAFGLTMTVFDPTNASTKTAIHAIGVAGNDANFPAAINAGGVYYTAEANDGLTFITGAASFTGFYRVYGIVES